MSTDTHKLKNLLKSDKWFLPHLRVYLPSLFASLALGILTVVFSVGLIFVSGYLVNESSLVYSVLILYIPLIFVQIFGLGKPLLHYFERLSSHDWVLRTVTVMRAKLFELVSRKNFAPGELLGLNDTLALLVDDIGHIQNLYLRCLFPLIISWSVSLACSVVLGFFSLKLALLELLVFLLVTLIVPLFSVFKTRLLSLDIKSAATRRYTHIGNDIACADEWRFANRVFERVALLARDRSSLNACRAALDAHAGIRDVFLELLSCAGLMFIIVWACAQFNLASGVHASWFTAFVLGFIVLTETLFVASDAAVYAVPNIESLLRLNSLDSSASEVHHATAIVEPEGFDIVFDRVDFSYGGPKKILHEVNLRIPEKQKIILLGRSGVGKSTFVNLLSGFLQPDEGRISIGGRSPEELGERISNYISVLSQQFYMFHMSLRDNLCMGNAAVSDEMLVCVLEAVGLKALLLELPKGLDTLLSEGGDCFSGGQLERLALARVLISSSPIVVLDEPFTGLDCCTEQRLMKALLHFTKDKTLIVVTHHLHEASYFDRVLFMEQARFSIDGTHEELLESNLHYAQLLRFDHDLPL